MGSRFKCCTERLIDLVNELLEVNRIKEGQFQYFFREHSLKEIIRRALADFRFSHLSCKISFHNKLNINKDSIIGDFDKLLQAILNVLDNAAKYCAPNTEIVMTLKSTSEDFVLSIKNHGKGIPKKDFPEIFNKFYKGNGPEEGLGLGLYLVKNIISQHRGSVKIFSKENKDTTVEIRLPRIKKAKKHAD